MTTFKHVLTDEEIEAMNARTAERRRAAIAALGPKWLGYVQHKPAPAANVAPIKQQRKAKP